MPAIPSSALNSTIYLYPTLDAARHGEESGGSEFLVGFQSSDQFGYHIYAVTNNHVIRERCSPIIKLNFGDDAKIIPIQQATWIHYPDGDDVAVCPIEIRADVKPRLDPAFNVIAENLFITRGAKFDVPIYPGDEVFMVVRFTTHELRDRNPPTVRFGNVAMLPPKPIDNH